MPFSLLLPQKSHSDKLVGKANPVAAKHSVVRATECIVSTYTECKLVLVHSHSLVSCPVVLYTRYSILVSHWHKQLLVAEPYSLAFNSKTSLSLRSTPTIPLQTYTQSLTRGALRVLFLRVGRGGCSRVSPPLGKTSGLRDDIYAAFFIAL